MAIPSITTEKINGYIRSDLEKMLSTLPKEGTDVAFDPIAVEKALKKDEMFIQPIVDPFKPLPIKAPVVRPQQEARTLLPVLTPPISKEVIIAPPMAVQTSSVLPLLVAGAILLMQ